MNVELVKSVALKFLPVLVSYLAGRGVSADVLDQLPALLDWVLTGVILIGSIAPTLWRSWRAYRTKKPIDLTHAQ